MKSPAPIADPSGIGTYGEETPPTPGRSYVGIILNLIAVVAVVLLVTYLGSDITLQYTSVAASTLAIAALGFFVVHQVGGATLAQAGAMAIGAYTSGILAMETGMPVFAAIVAGIAASAVIGALLGLLITRAHTAFHFILVTFVFSEVVRLVLERWVYGADGLPNIPPPAIGGFVFDTPERYYWLALGALGASVAFVWWLMSSNLARGFHTIRDGERHLAPSFGLGASRYKVAAFAVASGLAGLAGGLQAHFMNFVSPDQFNLNFSVLILTAAVFGGLNRVYGPVAGAFVLSFLSEALGDYPGVNIIVYGVVLVLAMLVVPNGVVGIATASRARILAGWEIKRGGA
jgi:branched-chain amino acid transport system permease protein